MPTALAISYAPLKSRVSRLIHDAHMQIESIRLNTYWQVGNILSDADRNTLRRLSHDLEIEQSLFYRMIQFSKSFPKPSGSAPLTWSHYKELLSLPDSVKRKHLAAEAHSESWTVRRLRREVIKVKDHSQSLRLSASGGSEARQSHLDEPPQGQPGIYQVGWLEDLTENTVKVIDFGFEIYGRLSAKEAETLKIGEAIIYDEKKQRWVPTALEKDLHYYQATVERVVDGDTLLVHLRFGENYFKRQYLRLRGVNTPPLSEALGKKAAKFLETKINAAPLITFKSRFRDPYDRYLSDVWVDGVYVNQQLLDRGFAVRV
jgi:endonuclease YncB( thermonuclease family)